jgi:predicted NBD/HSP70 family sugar kinase
MRMRRSPLEGIGTTQASIVKYLRRKGSASRVEIAELCGVTPAAVSMLTRDLIERGIIVEGARRQTGRGAPPIDLTLNPSAGYALGVHANRFLVTLTLLDFCGTTVGELQLPGAYSTFANVQSEIKHGKEQLLARNGIDTNLLIGAGIAMPTRFRQDTAFLDLAEEIISWAGSDLSSSLRLSLGCPVIIENDANAAAMGELTLGNAANYQHFAYLYLSEGIGSGIIIGQELYRGNVGNAGEIGALRSRGLPRPSFEDLADWCNERVGHIPQGRSPEIWTDYLNENSSVFKAWLDRAGPETARLAFMMAAVLAPSAIYIGGTLPKMVRERLAGWLDFAQSNPFEGARVLQPQILIPQISATDSVALGAAAMILHALPQPL